MKKMKLSCLCFLVLGNHGGMTAVTEFKVSMPSFALKSSFSLKSSFTLKSPFASKSPGFDRKSAKPPGTTKGDSIPKNSSWSDTDSVLFI